MKLTIHRPWTLVRTDLAKEIAVAKALALHDIDKQRDEFEKQVRKAIHGAYAGIVCAVCGKNVYRGEGTWVHGNGGKAYCLKPCWEVRNEPVKKELLMPPKTPERRTE